MKIDYYQTLKEMIENARFESVDLDHCVLYIPDLFRLLCTLLNEDISQDDRVMINCAIAYIAVCDDVVPEDIYGVKGLMDDLYVVCLVVKQLIKKYHGIVKKDWTNSIDDEPLETLLDKCYEKGYSSLEEEGLVHKVLKYAGLEPE